LITHVRRQGGKHIPLCDLGSQGLLQHENCVLPRGALREMALQAADL
jgi:hypothetical protein